MLGLVSTSALGASVGCTSTTYFTSGLLSFIIAILQKSDCHNLKVTAFVWYIMPRNLPHSKFEHGYPN